MLKHPQIQHYTDGKTQYVYLHSVIYMSPKYCELCYQMLGDRIVEQFTKPSSGEQVSFCEICLMKLIPLKHQEEPHWVKNQRAAYIC